MLRLRRDGEINGEHVPEIILLNSHDGTSSYQMLRLLQVRLPERVRLWPVSGEVRVPHRKCSGESYRRGLRGGGRV